MNSQELQATLSFLLKKIEKETIIWYLEGSVNLFVQGLPVQPKDIDITTNSAGLNKFRKLFKKETIKDFYIEETRAHVLKCLFNNVESEIAVYEDTEKSSFDTIKLLSWNSLQLPTQPLTQALKFYKLIGRKEKSELIEKHLAEKPNFNE